MKFEKRNLTLLILALLSSVLLFTGCTDEAEPVSEPGYGYVQFHLFKKGSYTKAGDKLEYLRDAAKIRVTLRSQDNDIITPVAVVEAVDKNLSEWGLQTAKIRLIAGKYTMTAYEIYDGLDNSVLVGAPSETVVLDVKANGIVSEDIALNVVDRGWAKFRLVKDLSEIVGTKAGKDGADEHPFYGIQSVDLTVKNKNTGEITEITNIEVTHKFVDGENAADPDYISGICVSDTLVALKGGTYTVTKFRTYFDYFRKVYETSTNVAENEFVVKDNQETDADVPVTLHTTSGHVQDALALREIWEALDGPNWRIKWEFNCDVDAWTANTGVQILGNGRVASLDLTGTGAKGAMPAAIAKLTELRKLTLGTIGYNAAAGGTTVTTGRKLTYFTPEDHEADRRLTIGTRDPRSRFSKELQQSFEIAGDPVKPGVKSLSERMPVMYKPEVNATDIVSLPDEINQLKNLEHITIAFSPIKTFPADMSGLTALTDVEIFACTELTEFPKGLATCPKLTSLTYSFNVNTAISSMEEGISAINNGPASKTIQLLYFPNQRIDNMPDLSNIPRLSVLVIQGCGLKSFTAPFSKDQFFVQFMASDNDLTSLPRDEKGNFLAYNAETEEVNFSGNKFTELPDIFDAKSAYQVGTVDFSKNQIASVEHGDAYRGIKAATFDISYNKLKELPVQLFGTSSSSISYLKIDGNGMEKISKEAIEGKYTYRTTTISMAYNKLKSLPDEFDSLTFPYLSGIDMSYNRFDYFPYTAVNNQYLSVFIFRHQRDADGDRCMRTWPAGIGQALAGLRALYLGSNDIRVVTDELSYMIYNLDIQDNPNISIDVSAVCSYIKSGWFNLMYSPGQDIRGCDEALKL
mgnify:FL=1